MTSLSSSWHAIEASIVDTASKVLGHNKSTISLFSRYIDDLGADSLDIVELVMEFEERLSIEINDDEVSDVQTVGESINYYFERYRRSETNRFGIVSECIALTADALGRLSTTVLASDGSWTESGPAQSLPLGVYLNLKTKWLESIDTLDKMINRDDLSENDLQRFFESNPQFMVGDQYANIVPQAILEPDHRRVNWRLDFMLSPVNQNEFAKIVELKMPDAKVIKREQSGHYNFYSEFNRSINQLKDYGRAFDSESTRQRFRERYGLEIFAPKLQLVIGRRWDVENVHTMLLKQKVEDVEIVDWDSLIDKIKTKIS